MSLYQCPTCLQIARELTNWQFSGLDDSIFNYSARFCHCEHCGLVFIENIDDKTLAAFYQGECAYFEKEHFDIDLPANIKKYNHYTHYLIKHGLENIGISDIGCGRGGFLKWIKQQGWQADCCGVDVDLKSIPELSGKSINEESLIFKQGGALLLPFADNSQTMLSYFHVFEHIRDIDGILSEANRVLNAEGYLLIEVPDAERYSKCPIGPAFWIGIREHIYHFSASALAQVLNRHGFSVVDISRCILPTPEFDYPSLMLLAKKTASIPEQPVNKVGDIACFVKSSEDALCKQVTKLQNLAKQYQCITFWGMSAELFSLLPLMKNIQVTLCDVSRLKQKSHYYDLEIYDPKKITIQGILVIAPYLHAESIEYAAIELGWASENIYCLGEEI